jgi:hypothetical protein
VEDEVIDGLAAGMAGLQGNRGEPELFNEEFHKSVLEPRELMHTMSGLTQPDDSGALKQRLQGIQVCESTAWIQRTYPDRVVAKPTDDIQTFGVEVSTP